MQIPLGEKTHKQSSHYTAGADDTSLSNFWD